MKTISIALQTHKAQPVTTLCDLLRIGPLPDGSVIACTSHDQNETYDDGAGELIYRAHSGFSGSSQTSTADLSVDNSEAETLIAEFTLPGVSQEMIDRGLLDKTPFICYRINYENHSDGHEILGAGTIGEQKVRVGGLVVLELRSISQQARQSVVELDSLTCRVRQFGSQVGDERFPCGYNITPEWIGGTVSAAGEEPTRQFDSVALTSPNAYFAPGVVEMLTGDNAGKIVEVESFAQIIVSSVVVGGRVTLQFTLPNLIQAGDTFRIRRDCTRAWTGHNSCATYWGIHKGLHYRGEPKIPIADAVQVPGAEA